MSQFFGKAVHAAFIVPDIRKEIDRLLARGGARARAIAEPIIARTYEIVGLAGR